MQTKYINVFFVILLLLISCTSVEKEKPDVKTLKSELQKSALDDQISLKEQQLETLRAEAQDLLDSLRAKELMLVIREAKLDSVEQALENIQVDLQQQQATLKKMRSSAYLVLFVGIVLLIFGLFILLKPKKPAQEKPVEKPYTKSDEKAEEKSKSESKVAEKPAGESAPSVAVKEESPKTGKTTTPVKKGTPKKDEQVKTKPEKKETKAVKEEKSATTPKKQPSKPAAKPSSKKPPAKE
ncbi:hypothetical protein JXQ31_07050 [candidate division KSB1 bacterium]|nr:hypothetical protein [candidate division KSB1 bacterium]